MNLLLQTLRDKFLADPEVPIEVFYARTFKSKSEHPEAYSIIIETMKEIDLNVPFYLIPRYFNEATMDIEGKGTQNLPSYLVQNNINMKTFREIANKRKKGAAENQPNTDN